MNIVGNPLVTVAIVTWNRKEDVLEAVRSVYDQEYDKFEIVVVDNHSTDGTADSLRRWFPNVNLVALEENRGAAGGRNLAIKAGKGEIVFFLDSDACLASDTLNQVVSKFRAEPEIGLIACKILNYHSRELDSYSWIYSEKDKADQNCEFPSYSFAACGAAIRTDVLDQVGPFWTSLFIFREEDELSLRVWDAGYRIIYCPEALVYHRVSPHRRVGGATGRYYELRNSLSVYLVRYPWWMLGGFLPLKVGLSIVKGVRRGHLRTVLKALLDTIPQLPALLRQRCPISNRTAREYLSLQRAHGPLRWDLASWLQQHD